jgi:hypothetical protein
MGYMLLAGKMFAYGLFNAVVLVGMLIAKVFQGILNNGIDMINGLISLINLFSDEKIDLVTRVTFADDFVESGIEGMESRNQDLKDTSLKIAAEHQVRVESNQALQAEYAANSVERKNQYNAAKAAHETTSASEFESASGAAALNDAAAVQQMNDRSYDSSYTGSGAGTGYDSSSSGYSDSASASDEDLGYMRDLAEQDVINQFTTAEVRVDMANTFGDIRETADLDGVLSFFTDKLTEQLAVVAEGVY